MSKKRKVEEKNDEKKSLKRKFVQTSYSKTYIEEDFLDIVHTIRRNVGGKRIIVNTSSTLMDNVSFHSEMSV